LAAFRLAQDERRVVALDLLAQRLLGVVDEGGIEERGQRGHSHEDESRDRARAQGAEALVRPVRFHERETYLWAMRTFEASRRQIPVKARTGTWLLQFDQKPTYSDPPDAVFVQLQIRVFRDFPG